MIHKKSSPGLHVFIDFAMENYCFTLVLIVFHGFAKKTMFLNLSIFQLFPESRKYILWEINHGEYFSHDQENVKRILPRVKTMILENFEREYSSTFCSSTFCFLLSVAPSKISTFEKVHFHPSGPLEKSDFLESAYFRPEVTPNYETHCTTMPVKGLLTL